MMTITKEISSRFRFVTSVCMILVVFSHAKFIESRWEGVMCTTSWIGKISFYLQFLLSQNICRVTVLVFFFISGFWMAHHFDGKFSSYKQKLLKRVKTLFIPYLLFCSLWMLAYILMGRMKMCSVFDIFYHWVVSPVPFQFWFLQDLMVMILLFYPLYLLLKRYPISTLLVFMIWFYMEKWSWCSLNDACFYFSMGIVIAQHDFRKIKPIFVKLGVVLYGALLGLLLWNGSIYVGGNQMVYHTAQLLAVVVTVYWIFYSSSYPKYYLSAGLSFFIFAFHEPLQSTIKTAYITYGFSSAWKILLGYFAIPVFVILICTATYYLLNKFMPRFLSLLSGDRSK